MVEKELLTESRFLKAEFSKHGINPMILTVSVEPHAEEIRSASELCAGADLTILFCFDAHLYPSNKELLDTVVRKSRKTAAIFLRDFYDAEFVPETVPCVTDFGWRACQISASIRKLFAK